VLEAVAVAVLDAVTVWLEDPAPPIPPEVVPTEDATLTPPHATASTGTRSPTAKERLGTTASSSWGGYRVSESKGRLEAGADALA
jgi:hypothetical protein